MFTKPRKAFTFVELIVVAMVLLTSISAWMFLLRNTAGTNENVEVDQEYYALYSSLMLRVRKDLRSATEFQEREPNTWRLKILMESQSAQPESREILYRFTEKSGLIERLEGGIAVRYDFSRFLGGKKLVFRISL